MATFNNTSEFRGAEFTQADLSGTTFTDVTFEGATIRDAVLSGVRMLGVVLQDVEISGELKNVRVNGVDIAALDAQHPERPLLRSAKLDELRQGLAAVEAQWGETMRRARQLPAAELDRSVGGEWSFKQTVRHLVGATDAWLSHALLGEENPF